MSFEHLTIQDRDTKSLIEAIGTANDAVPGQWYLATNTNEYYYGAQDGSLIGPILAASDQFIKAVDDTDDIALAVDVDGQLTASVILDPDEDNLLTTSATGLFAHKYTIHPDSADLLEIDGDNRIRTKQLLFSSVTVDDTSASLAAHLTSVSYSTPPSVYQESDSIVLTQTNETFIQNGGVAGTTADFTKISINITDSYIRNLLSGASGVDYNPASGVFTLNQSFTRGLFSGSAPISYASGTGVFSLDTNGITNTHFRQSVGVSVVGRSANITGNVADIVAGSDGHFLVRRSGAVNFGPLVAADITSVGGVTGAVNGLTKVGNNAELGGALTKDTEISGSFPLRMNLNTIISKDYGQFQARVVFPGNQESKATFRFPITLNTAFNADIYFGSVTEANPRVFLRANVGGCFLLGNATNFLTNTTIFSKASSTQGDITISNLYLDAATNEICLDLFIKNENASARDFLFYINGYGRRMLELNNAYLSSVSAATFPTPKAINTTGFTAINSMNGAEYPLDVNGDQRGSGGLWIGTGTPTLATGVITAQTGFRINNVATTGHYMRGNGTNYVGSALLASDLSGQVAVANGGTGLSTLGTAGQMLQVNAGGTALEYVDAPSGSAFDYENALTEAAGTVKWGGALTGSTTVGMGTHNLFFTRSSGKVTWFNDSAGPSGFNVYASDLEIQPANPATALNGVILYSANGTRWRIVVNNDGALTTEEL